MDYGALIRQLQGALGGRAIKAGQFTTGSLSAGNNVVLIDLPEAWPNQHVAFLAYPQPLSTAFTITSHYGGVVSGTSLSQGFVHMVTSGSAQAFLISWISVGR